VPLAQKLDQYVSSQHDHIECSWHGALFRVEDGFCVAGPCRAQSLKAWPVAVEDGMIVTR
jgi:nitrite reductase/ring-hydroxylating ferredoxin subunit